MYSVFDPTQKLKPHGRTKDIISVKHETNPRKLDTVVHPGSDTLWKCYKRQVWKHPEKPFLGARTLSCDHFCGLNDEKPKLGNYSWKTFSEIDQYVEAASRSFISRGFCPLIKSKVQGTPDLKFLGIFSENRPEWTITEIACTGDSVVIVPIAVEKQFKDHDRIASIIETTELTTVCVSQGTLSDILELKQKKRIKTVKNIVLFDQTDAEHINMATQVKVGLFLFEDLVTQGF